MTRCDICGRRHRPGSLPYAMHLLGRAPEDIEYGHRLNAARTRGDIAYRVAPGPRGVERPMR